MPLIAAASEVSARLGDRDSTTSDGKRLDTEALKAEAGTIAALLKRSAELSQKLASKTGLEQNEGDKDALRLGMTAVSGPVVAGIYRLSGKIPEEKDVQNVTEAFETVFPEADKAVNIEKAEILLKCLGGESASGLSQTASKLFGVQALVPVINSVIANDFGQDRKILVKEISEKIMVKKDMLSSSLALKDEEKTVIDHVILKALCVLYSQCHFSESSKLQQDSDKKAALQNVWKAFDLRLELMQTLVENLLLGDPGKQGDSPALTERVTEQKTEQKSEQKAPETATAEGNPMAFFSSAPKQAQTPSSQAPASQPSPADKPPPVQPTEKSVENSGSGSSEGAQSQNPMSFFKKPPSDGEES